MLKNKNMVKYFSAAFSAVFIFISIFANCFHVHHLEKWASEKSSCTMGKPAAGIIAAPGEEHKDCEGECAACSYLQAAQGAYFDNVYLPEKQAFDQYSVTEPKLFHIEICIEYPPRAPPYFIA